MIESPPPCFSYCFGFGSSTCIYLIHYLVWNAFRVSVLPWRSLIPGIQWRMESVACRARPRKRNRSSRAWWVKPSFIWKKATCTTWFPPGPFSIHSWFFLVAFLSHLSWILFSISLWFLDACSNLWICEFVCYFLTSHLRGKSFSFFLILASPIWKYSN